MTQEKKKRPILFVLIDGVGDVSIPSHNTRDTRKLERGSLVHDDPSVSYSTPLQSTSTPFLDAIARMFLTRGTRGRSSVRDDGHVM